MTSGIKKRHGLLHHWLMFDTGIINNVFKSEHPEHELQFWNSANEISFTKKPSPFLFSTPLLRLELLGISIRSLDPYTSDATIKTRIDSLFFAMTMENFDKTLADVFDIIFQWISKSELTSFAEQSKRLYAQLSRKSQWARGVMQDALIGDSVNCDESRKNLIWDLTYDRLQAIPYHRLLSDSHLIKQVDLVFLSTSLQDMKNQTAYASCRISDSLIIRAVKAVEDKDIDAVYESDGDLLDTEIAYYSVAGVRRNRFLRPKGIVAFTTERLFKWRARAERYLGLIRFLSEENKKTSEPFVIRPGFIVRVASNGEMMDIIDLKSELNFTGIACDQDLVFQEWGSRKQTSHQ